MQQRIVKIKDNKNDKTYESETPFAIKEKTGKIIAFFDTHFESIAMENKDCQMYNYYVLNHYHFYDFKAVPLSEFYETKNKELGFDASQKEIESSLIILKYFETLKKEMVKKPETIQAHLIKDILNIYSELEDELKDNAGYNAGILMCNLKRLIDKLK